MKKNKNNAQTISDQLGAIDHKTTPNGAVVCQKWIFYKEGTDGNTNEQTTVNCDGDLRNFGSFEPQHRYTFTNNNGQPVVFECTAKFSPHPDYTGVTTYYNGVLTVGNKVTEIRATRNDEKFHALATLLRDSQKKAGRSIGNPDKLPATAREAVSRAKAYAAKVVANIEDVEKDLRKLGYQVDLQELKDIATVRTRKHNARLLAFARAKRQEEKRAQAATKAAKVAKRTNMEQMSTAELLAMQAKLAELLAARA